VRDVLLEVTGREPVSWTPVDEGGYSPGRRFLVRFADGGTAFVKTGWSVADEVLVYSTVSARCLPRLLAHAADVLVIEDLSHARWGTPVTDADCDLLVAAFDELEAAPVPEGLGSLEMTHRWAVLAADPGRLLRTGLVDEAWLRHLPALVEADVADLAGDALVHPDLWLQNWCRDDDRGAVIVDWWGAARANATFLRAHGEAGVRSAGHPGGRVLRDAPEWAALLAGFATWHVVNDPPESMPRLVETLRREAWATLRWACDDLGLPYPTPGPEIASLGPWRP
jgi:hypothetical protein